MSHDIGKFALCLGSFTVNPNVQSVQLLRLDDPMCVSTRRCQQEEKFAVGRWYQQKQPKQFELVDDVLPTTIIRNTLHQDQATGKVIIELVLPIFFPPNFAGISSSQFAPLPALKNFEDLGRPVCPLFGPEGIENLPAVKWSNSYGPRTPMAYSNELYALKFNVSYSIGAAPEWTPQNVGQLKPWKYSEHPAMRQFVPDSHAIGLAVAETTHTLPNEKNIQLALLLDEKAELMVALFPDGKGINLGQYRHCWPFKLDCYEFPVVIALDCPQDDILPDMPSNLHLVKLANDKFEITCKLNNLMASALSVPWLGTLMDPFDLIDDKNIDASAESVLQIGGLWNLQKRSAVWLVDRIREKCEKNSAHSGTKVQTNSAPNSSATNGQMLWSNGLGEVKKCGLDQSCASSVCSFTTNKSENILSKTSTVRPSGPSKTLPIVEKKMTAIAAYMAINKREGDAVFLFWDMTEAKFTHKYTAKFNTTRRFNREENIGKWFQLQYAPDPNKSGTGIRVFDFEETKRLAVTRVRDGICAQFSTNREKFIKVWHAVFPCSEKANYYEDVGWWPLLCRKCFPNLRSLSPLRIGSSNAKNAEDIAAHQEDKGERTTTTSLGPSAESSPATKRKRRSKKNKTAAQSPQYLAVLFTIRNDGYSVFLIFDEQAGEFIYRIYADQRAVRNECGSGFPHVGIGTWYKIAYIEKLLDGQKVKEITLLAVVNSRVQTRVKERVAQFNSKQRFVKSWHKNTAVRHNHYVNDGPWWPHLCSDQTCYPFAVPGPATAAAPAGTATNKPSLAAPIAKQNEEEMSASKRVDDVQSTTEGTDSTSTEEYEEEEDTDGCNSKKKSDDDENNNKRVGDDDMPNLVGTLKKSMFLDEPKNANLTPLGIRTTRIGGVKSYDPFGYRNNNQPFDVASTTPISVNATPLATKIENREVSPSAAALDSSTTTTTTPYINRARLPPIEVNSIFCRPPTESSKQPPPLAARSNRSRSGSRSRDLSSSGAISDASTVIVKESDQSVVVATNGTNGQNSNGHIQQQPSDSDGKAENSSVPPVPVPILTGSFGSARRQRASGGFGSFMNRFLQSASNMSSSSSPSNP